MNLDYIIVEFPKWMEICISLRKIKEHNVEEWNPDICQKHQQLVKESTELQNVRDIGDILEHKTCDILAAERLRLIGFDNRLIIDSFQKAICILKISINNKFQTEKYESTSTQIHFQKC